MLCISENLPDLSYFRCVVKGAAGLRSSVNLWQNSVQDLRGKQMIFGSTSARFRCKALHYDEAGGRARLPKAWLVNHPHAQAP